MKKKVIVVITLSALLFVSVAGFVMADELLTLRNVVEQAISGSPLAKLNSLGAERAQLEYEIADEKADLYRNLLNTTGDVEGEAEALKYLYIDAVVAENDKEIAEKHEELSRNDLVYKVKQSYLQLYQAKEQKMLTEESLKRAEDIKRIAEAAYAAGTAAKSEVMMAESQVASMEAALFGAESGEKIAEASLNMLLGRELSDPVTLEETLTLPEVEEVVLESGETRALRESMDILKARAGLKMAQGAREYAKYLLGVTDKNYEATDIGVQEAEIGLELARDTVRLEVFGLYQKLTGMEKQLAARQKALDLAAENYRIAKLRYELGVGTQGQMTDAMLKLSEAELALLSDQFEHYTNYLDWRLLTGLPVE